MNPALNRRLAALSGLALAAAVGLWWLGSTRLALNQGSDASRPASDALHSLWLVRGMGLMVLALRAGALRGWRAGAEEALALVAPSWPLVVLAWSASATPWTRVAVAELALVAGTGALPMLGLALRRTLRQAPLAEAMGTAIGLALAASLWFWRGAWSLPLA